MDPEQEARDNLAALLRDALAEREQLTLINNNLQRKVLAFKDKDKKKKVDCDVMPSFSVILSIMCFATSEAIRPAATGR